MRVVGPALGQKVHCHAGRRNGRIRSTRGHLHFLERLVVVVRRRPAGGRLVRDRDAIHVPVVGAEIRPLPREDALLTVVVGTRDHVVGQHPRAHLQDPPRVPRGRYGLQLLVGEVRPRARLANIQQRHLAADRHRGRDARNRHRNGDIRVRSRVDDHVRALDRCEPGQIRLDRVGPRVDVDEPEITQVPGRDRPGRAHTRQRDRHAGQNAPTLVRDLPV